jgi:ABC-type transport system substrate-binding protein
MKRGDFLISTAALMGSTAVFTKLTTLSAVAQETPVKGGTLIWGHPETLQNLGMHQTGTASTSRGLQNVYSSIVTVDANLNALERELAVAALRPAVPR